MNTRNQKGRPEASCLRLRNLTCKQIGLADSITWQRSAHMVTHVMPGCEEWNLDHQQF